MDISLNTIVTLQVANCRQSAKYVRSNDFVLTCFVRAFVCTVGSLHLFQIVCASEKKHYLYEVNKLVLKVWRK